MLLTSREIPVQSYISKHYINTLNQHGGQNKGTRSTSIVVLFSLLFTLNTLHTTFNISQLLLRVTLNKYYQKKMAVVPKHLFVNFGIYLFKVNKENPGKMCEICSKLTIKISELLTLQISLIVSMFSDFEYENASWLRKIGPKFQQKYFRLITILIFQETYFQCTELQLAIFIGPFFMQNNTIV